jgi:hypothetical protein
MHARNKMPGTAPLTSLHSILHVMRSHCFLPLPKRKR